jgi:dCTP diphosphatase
MIQGLIRDFASEREWLKFHNPKNITSALAVESAELLEIFQWLEADESWKIMETAKAEAVKHEVADIAVYLLRLCDLLKIDLNQAILEKIEINRQKYPVEKSKGSAKKYTEL